MSGLLKPVSSILELLSSLVVLNQTGQNVPLYTRVWNDQFRKVTEGQIEHNPLPAAYLELVPIDTTEIGQGVFSGDVIFRIHLGHENLDNGDNTYQQDLLIFYLRDLVIGKLNHFQPPGCSMLTKVHDEPNYDHANVYVWAIDFACTLIDDSGSYGRPDSGKFISSVPPLSLEIDLEIQKAGEHQLVQQKFIINGST